MSSKPHLGFATALAMLLASQPVAAQQATALGVRDGKVAITCPLTIGGNFVAKTANVSGQLHLVSSEGGDVAGEITVDLTSLDTGIGLRNRHMCDNYLEVGKGADFEKARLSSLKLEPKGALGTGEVGFTAMLTIHGVAKEVKGTADVRAAGSEYVVKSAFAVNLPAYDIAKPRHLGIGVKDDVKIEIEFTLAPATAAAAGGQP